MDDSTTPSTGLPLQGGSLNTLPDSASLSQLIVAINELIGNLNDQLQLKNFTDGNVPILQYGFLPDGNIGVQLNNTDGSIAGDVSRAPDGTIGMNLYGKTGNIISSFAKRPDGTIGTDIFDPSKNLVASFGQLVSGAVGSKFFDGSGIGQALFGKYTDGNTHLRVATAGVEVETATPDQLIFNSDQDMLKVVETGNINISGSSGTVSGQWSVTPASGNITFSKYTGANTPAVLIFVQDVSGNLTPTSDGSTVLVTFASGFSQIATRRFSVTPSGINFHIEYKGFLSAGSTSQPFNETYFYYVLQETI